MQINSTISPSLPLAFPMAFATLIAFRRWLFNLNRHQLDKLNKVNGTSAALLTVLGLVICLLSILVCFAFSGIQAEHPSPTPGLTGLNAWSTAYALPIYGAIVEEAAFRAQLQLRMESMLSPFGAMCASSVAFIAIHTANEGFFAYWPLYLSITIVCGLLVLKLRSVYFALIVHSLTNLLGGASASLLNDSADMLSESTARVVIVFLLVSGLSIFFWSIFQIRRAQPSTS
ncbi:MAG TPA: CPBP family intramembrane glutamic endopeptidase [Steroidobacteraceae bacterium]|nr:CPBP family intramembrane glutamic endopeptidase [Steroidobacteraceae bacterium]